MITKDIKYIGVDDHITKLFEGQYKIPNGISYNSYVIMDEKTAIMDTVDVGFSDKWLENLQSVLGTKIPQYLIIQHMEPDHSASIVDFLEKYPQVTIVSSAKSFAMMKNYFGTDFAEKRLVVADGDTLNLGRHKLVFVAAPMVHWPEVIVTYDETDKVLFSADGFGKFGALDKQEKWTDEARRYYIGIVGKYGVQVGTLLKKLSTFDINAICPLHGPVLKENIGYYLEKYSIWSSYKAEEDGIVIAYTSVYGNTKKAVLRLCEELKKNTSKDVIVYDLARCDMSEAVSMAFKYSKLVLATTTYNAEIFPFMREFICHLTERNFSNRTVAFIENGSWAPMATKIMKSMLEKSKNLTFVENSVTLHAALNNDSIEQIKSLARELS